MLTIYGPLMPVRLLEEIQCWKNQEQEHTVLVHQMVPELEPTYVQLLNEWEHVFIKTEETARNWLHAIQKNNGQTDAALNDQIELLLKAAVYQSEQFTEQLDYLKQYSQAVQNLPLVSLVIAHIVRESYVFVSAAQALASMPLAAISNHAAQPAEPKAHIHALRSVPPSAAQPHAADDRTVAQALTGGADGIRAVIGTGRGQRPNGGKPWLAGSSNGAYAAVATAAAGIGAGAAADAGAAAGAESQRSVAPIAASQVAKRPDNVYVPPGGHRLPPLPYPYYALEPHIDEKTMRIHHNQHHQTYVDGLNHAELALVEARRTGNYESVKALSGELAFNGAGHYLHTIFWDTMNPHGGGEPNGELRQQIERDFGSYEAFKEHFSQAAVKVEGGGWVVLVWSPRSRRLEILQAEKHQNLSQWDIVPLLPVDVWEHAYYLKHQNKRADYITDWWNVVYWPIVNERYVQARKLQWEPF
ncbi:Fe-Mn family superoxide dismutase [Paenibacillus sp. UMB4589-SE434]|uniref:Fe-Mn family superoxide dismutase n=1 Tax=Paenibacillus sp. UMB4589-SE434 TaxID=3046314 RepID=UPI00254CC67C|nr:Fe-Mn family superoxide dismutase [Paenibacillus sp. UMB4589-SE434]MDK8182757.1 Fe-Mn family superoxide dismutase [Paenibacillus sp. UMB4589-SE434]